jgi:hypothetical protein
MLESQLLRIPIDRIHAPTCFLETDCLSRQIHTFILDFNLRSLGDNRARQYRVYCRLS